MARNLKLYETNAEFLENETVSPSAVTLEYNFPRDIYNDQDERIGVEYIKNAVLGGIRTVSGVSYYTDGEVLIDMETLMAKEVLAQVWDSNKEEWVPEPHSISGWTFYPNITQKVAFEVYEAEPGVWTCNYLGLAFRALNENGEELWIGVEPGSNFNGGPKHEILSATSGTFSGCPIVDRIDLVGLKMYDKVKYYNEKPVTTSVYPGVSLTEGNKVAYNPMKIRINITNVLDTKVNELTFENLFKPMRDYVLEHPSDNFWSFGLVVYLNGCVSNFQIRSQSFNPNSTYEAFQEEYGDLFNTLRTFVNENRAENTQIFGYLELVDETR